jgi:hypothetical protein
MAGFGGVAEYGITVRWDKNFLKLIRLLLERRRQFAMFGGVRFGGTLTIDEAYAGGFDHIALCAGAGRPTVLEIPNGFARGVRAASDFLMALQLTGAAKRESIANLQIRLPIVVIGGGLTAIDTSDTGADLVWYPVTGATTYRVSRAAVDGIFHKIGDVIGASFGDSGLTPQSNYRWHVSAIVNGVEGPASADAIATTRAAPPPCNTPGSCPINR